jgi:hypothetical protein
MSSSLLHREECRFITQYRDEFVTLLTSSPNVSKEIANKVIRGWLIFGEWYLDSELDNVTVSILWLR